MQRVLVLCTGNSCRSQMAEALFQRESGGTWHAESAGSAPSGYVHPLAIEVMKELDCDLSGNRSKHLDEFLEKPFDLVVTVCGRADQACPQFPGAAVKQHWPFDDPADATGTDEEKRIVFRQIRDQIQARIREYLKANIG